LKIKFTSKSSKAITKLIVLLLVQK